MTRGADALGVDQSTVSRRITNLEKHLEVKLFERHTTGYIPTHAGRQLLHHAERVEDELIEVERRVVGQDRRISGSIRVSTSAHLATELLATPLVDFAEENPEIEVNLAITNSLVDMNKYEADIIIRITTSPPETLVGRELADITAALYASKKYWTSCLKQSKKKTQAKGYRGYRWIGNAWPGEASEARKKKYLPKVIPANPRPTGHVNELLAMKQLIKAGLGVGRLPCFMGDVDPSLQRASPVFSRAGWSLWLLTHEDLRHTTRVRLFTDFMAKALNTQKDLIEGRTADG